jgi:hypothetical protein
VFWDRVTPRLGSLRVFWDRVTPRLGSFVAPWESSDPAAGFVRRVLHLRWTVRHPAIVPFLRSIAHPEHRQIDPTSFIIETSEGFEALGSRKSME